jgi:hypothetical protein
MTRTGFYAYIILEYDPEEGDQDNVSALLNEALKTSKDLRKDLLLSGVKVIGLGVTGDTAPEDCD